MEMKKPRDEAGLFEMVCVVGIEPTTPTVSRWCSPTELHARTRDLGEYSKAPRGRQTIRPQRRAPLLECLLHAL